MGRSKPVKIGQKEFKSKKAAVDYFMDQREAVKTVGPLKEGELFDELRDLYLRYCKATRFDLNGRVIYAFSVDYEPRQNGQAWASHLCYWVHFSPKDQLSFSVREAVDEITKASAENKL
ncbi:hypothetical protein JEQ04_18830 [Serratia plymuthica]|uniref:hypothetical protein n=1 Tax=Serratia plymuthica TaxID=82996 RepID=UPI0018E4858C|nr:hypothetical protein [Serratia plymuthica]MBI6139903.1 hypothetical protein [Serratia plymuthica]